MKRILSKEQKIARVKENMKSLFLSNNGIEKKFNSLNISLFWIDTSSLLLLFNKKINYILSFGFKSDDRKKKKKGEKRNKINNEKKKKKKIISDIIYYLLFSS